MLLATLDAARGAVMRVAKGDRRVGATGMAASHAAVRTTLSAVARNTWSKRVFARPMSRDRRRSQRCTPWEIVPSIPARVAYCALNASVV